MTLEKHNAQMLWMSDTVLFSSPWVCYSSSSALRNSL